MRNFLVVSNYLLQTITFIIITYCYLVLTCKKISRWLRTETWECQKTLSVPFEYRIETEELYERIRVLNAIKNARKRMNSNDQYILGSATVKNVTLVDWQKVLFSPLYIKMRFKMKFKWCWISTTLSLKNCFGDFRRPKYLGEKFSCSSHKSLIWALNSRLQLLHHEMNPFICWELYLTSI